MGKLERLSMVAAMLLLSAVMIFVQQKSSIHIPTTGGTITGAGTSATATNYTAGQVVIGTLFDAVPELKNIANVAGEQVVKIGPQDMNNDVWLALAKKVNRLPKYSDIDGIVITHGTDTMEETVYFLSLTVKSDKPAALVEAIHPFIVLSADGPLNLYNTVVVVGAKEFREKGVLVAMNGSVLDVASVLRVNTIDVQTFQAPNDDALGCVLDGRVIYNMSSAKKHTTRSILDVANSSSLPKVGIVYSYSNVEANIVILMLDSRYKDIIHTEVGNGNIHKDIFPILIDAREKGILAVHLSRVPIGPTSLDAEADDAQYQLIASQKLDPRKSCVLLMLVLIKTDDRKQIQKYLNEY